MQKSIQMILNHLRLSRPYYVLPVVATGAAGYTSSAGNSFSWICLCGVVLTFLLLDMSCWAANEITDMHSDSKGNTKKKWGIYVSGGTGILSKGLISTKSAFIYVVLLAITGIAIASFLNAVFLGLAFIFFLILMSYSVKPIRLKEKGVLGIACIASANGLVTFMAGWVAGGNILNFECLIFAGLASIIFFGFEGIPHLLDYSQDKRNNENTIAVSLGENTTIATLAFCQILPLLAIIMLNLFTQQTILNLNIFLIAPMFLISILISLALVVKRTNTNALSTLRVISVPMMSTVVFLIA